MRRPRTLGLPDKVYFYKSLTIIFLNVSLCCVVSCSLLSVRADRVSQLRFCFARATPEELFENLQARGWDVQRACDAFGHNDDYDGSAEGLRRDNSRYPCPMEVDSFSDELPAPRRLSPASLWRASHGGVSVGRMRPPEELAWFGVRGGEARELRDRFRTVAAVPPALWRHRPVDVFSVSHFGRSLGP